MLSPRFTLSRDMRKGRAALSHIPGGRGGTGPPTKNHNKLSGIGVCSFFDFCAGAGDDADDADADDGLGLETFWGRVLRAPASACRAPRPQRRNPPPQNPESPPAPGPRAPRAPP